MKKTIEFLKKKGIVERIQSAVDFAPKQMCEDDKDPNCKEFQKSIIMNALYKMENEDFNKFIGFVADDIIYHLGIKKNDKEGNKIASIVYEIVKELGK